MTLRAPYLLLAQKLQEAADGTAADIGHKDVCARLCDALNDANADGAYYGYVDHTGDGESGDVIYMCNGDMMRAPYEIGEADGKATCNIDMDNAVDVVPMTTYEEEAEDEDHYTGMQEAFRESKTYTSLPLYERFISKGERKGMSAEDFAGKNRSFPINKPGDVMAAMHSLGRAGGDNYSTATIRANIIRIAKRKGFALPKSAQEDGAKESRKITTEGLRLVESLDWKEESLALVESDGGSVRMPIKLMKAGQGSSAFYPKEVLQRDGPKVFTKGTHIYINHATEAEMKARPEGDWHKLAGALESNAYWDDNGKAGAGLYAEALFTSDYAPLIREKAKFTGMSINARGNSESGRERDGKPILKELTSAESVDVVTRAGAGGMILTEAARPNSQQEADGMTAEEANRLIEAAVAPIKAQLSRAEARNEAVSLLESSALTKEQRAYIVDRVMERELPSKDGAFDVEKFREAVVKETQEFAKVANPGGARVVGMGTAAPVQLTEADREKRRADAKRAKEDAEEFEAEGIQIFEAFGLPKEAARLAVRGAA